MQVDDCYQLGYIVKAHGLKGEVQVAIDSDDPKVYQELESVFVLQGQQLVPFFIETIAIHSNKAIVSFEDITTVDEAKALKGQRLYLPLEVLPDLKDDEFYLHELVGFQIIDAFNKMSIGAITNVLEIGSQLTLVVEHESGKEILIPFSEELKISLDKKKRCLTLLIADGLIDLYLSEDEN